MAIENPICFWKKNPPFEPSQLRSMQQLIMGDALSDEQNQCSQCAGTSSEIEKCDKAIRTSSTNQVLTSSIYPECN